MAPPPAALVDDLVGEILLRLPPDEPALLVRASLVCKPWRRILSDPAFLPRFRAFHRRPPILGFLSNNFAETAVRSTFVSTSAFSPPHRDLNELRVLDSRHGRVLFRDEDYLGYNPHLNLLVWDPVTDEEWLFPMPTFPEPVGMYYKMNGAVLCAADGCDHLDCHGGPFLVVFLGTGCDQLTSALVYSSESAEWSEPTPDEEVWFDEWSEQDLLIGNTLYFLTTSGDLVMQYDLQERALSAIDLPHVHCGALMTAEDGGLGFAGVLGSSLHLWSREHGPDGSVGWAQRRVIDLGTLLPADALRNSQILTPVGFAEGVGVIFVRTTAGVFTIEPKSLESRKVSARTDIYRVYPYMSFYTPGA